MRLDHALALAVTGYVGVLIVLVPGGDIGLLSVLLLIGVLVMRELAGAYASKALRERVDFFVYAGLVAFVAVVVQRVREILNL